MRKGENSQALKRNNRALVLDMALTGNARTRVELARKTGLNKMTISNIVGELIEYKYLTEGVRASTGSVGRKPVELLLSPDAPKIIGLHIARGGCSAILTDLTLKPLARSREIRFSVETARSVMDKSSRLIREIMPNDGRVLGIGVATIGQHDISSGNVLCPVDFFGIRDIPVKQIMRERFGLPVSVDNDMNGAALAENLFGNARDADCFLYVGITHGVGAGIVMNGELIGNSSGLVGEIGHMSVDIHGEPCACGNRGCLELYTSIPKIEKKIAERSGRERPFSECVKQLGDPDVDAVLSEMCDTLAFALTGAVNLLDPTAILIGHEAALLPDKYIDRIERELNARIIARDYKHVTVRHAAFSTEAPLYGGACSLLGQLLNGTLF